MHFSEEERFNIVGNGFPFGRFNILGANLMLLFKYNLQRHILLNKEKTLAFTLMASNVHELKYRIILSILNRATHIFNYRYSHIKSIHAHTTEE